MYIRTHTHAILQLYLYYVECPTQQGPCNQVNWPINRALYSYVCKQQLATAAQGAQAEEEAVALQKEGIVAVQKDNKKKEVQNVQKKQQK